MLTHTEKWFPQTATLYRLVIFGLLALALSSVALGVASLVQELTFAYLLFLTLAALGMSWWLAGRSQKSWKSSLVVILLGVLIAFLWVGQILELLLAWLGTFPELIWQSLQRSEDVPAKLAAFQVGWTALQIRLSALFSDLAVWLRSLLVGKPAFNYTATGLIWGLTIWLVAAWAGWRQRRRDQSLIAILPGGILLLSIMGYSYGSTTALLVLMFATLLLVAANHYICKERLWKERNMDFPEAKRGEIFSLFIGLSLVFMLAAALIPRISITAILEKVQAWASPRISQVDPFLESFGLEHKTNSTETFEAAIAGGLPRQHLIGAGPELSEQVVMKVKLIGLTQAELEKLSIPLYWRSRTYNRYTGRGWQTSPVTVQFYSANEETQTSVPSGYHTLRQEFSLVMERDFIYAAGEIISLDKNYHLAWRTTPEIAAHEPFNADFFAGTVEGRVYRVTSQFPATSEAELQAATGVYPTWIAARYRALPSSLPTRVADLALELTRTAPTPYDKARAIETYLRTFEYQLNLPDPPNNRDLVDTFLFELQKGYCDYYASAMVVLARTAGLPARLAVGYTRGEYDSAEQVFIVTEENAHTWAEIYFTGIGWVPFEPTAAQPEIRRSQQNLSSLPDLEPASNLDLLDLITGWNLTPWLIGVAGILPVAALLAGIWFLLDAAYLRFLSPSQLANTLFRRLYRYGPRLGTQSRVGNTPYEFIALLEQQVIPINQPKFQQVSTSLRTLSHFYVRATFGPQPLIGAEKAQLLRLWPGLHRQLLLASWLFFWQTRVKKVATHKKSLARVIR